MKISIGILAWNEEDIIESTIASLFAQSVFALPPEALAEFEWDILVVPNGCKDNTEVVTATALSRHVENSRNKQRIQASVRSIPEAGKSNAWNRYIHEFSAPDTDLILMIDADIEFGHTDTIANSVTTLLSNPSAKVCVDLPLKSFAKKDNNTLIEKISLSLSSEVLKGPPAIAGSFYCARATLLRQIWMPEGLSGEDGFLRAMIVTNLFRNEPDVSAIIRAENASHYYEGLSSLRGIFRHEVRLTIGTTFNCYLCWDFLRFATDPTGPGAGVLIKNQITNDPNWYRNLIQNEILNRRFWTLPRGVLFRRFNRLRGKSLLRKILETPLTLAIFLVDFLIQLSANRTIKSGKAIGFW